MDKWIAASLIYGAEHDGEEDVPGVDTPETDLITKQALQNLSNEAKFVLKLLIDTPQELQDMMKYDLEIMRVKDYLRIQGWKWPLIRKTIAELKHMV